jgi:hypothetical protein
MTGESFWHGAARNSFRNILQLNGTRFGIRRFKYQLFGRLWVVRWDEAECQRIGVLIHHAADYIKLGVAGTPAITEASGKRLHEVRSPATAAKDAVLELFNRRLESVLRFEPARSQPFT